MAANSTLPPFTTRPAGKKLPGGTDLQPALSGTLLTESHQFLWCPVVGRLAELPVPRGRQLRRDIRQTLVNIKAAAEAWKA